MKKTLYFFAILLGMVSFYGCETEEEIVPVDIHDEGKDPHGKPPIDEGGQTRE